MKWETLPNDPDVKNWLKLACPAPYTKRNYLMSLQMFMDFTGLSPGELIAEADADIRAGVLPRERKMKQRLIAFKADLADRDLSPNTQHNYMSGVKSFYRAFDHDIPNLGKPVDAKPMEEHLDIPSKEDIREALKVCDARDRAIILVGCSSGLSASSIVELTIEQFFKGYDEETGICTLFLRRGKTNTDFITFLNPEACAAVLEYLNYRNRTIDYTDTRREDQLKKQHWAKDSVQRKGKKAGKRDNDEPNGQYLFIKRMIHDNYLRSKSEKLRKLDIKGLLKAYSDIADRSQKSNGPGVWNLIRSHNMRKFFNSALKNAGMEGDLVEFMMGHTLGSTRDAYFRGNAQSLKARYSENMAQLTIQKEIDVAASSEYMRILEQNKLLVTEAERFRVERDEISDLRTELDEIKHGLYNEASNYHRKSGMLKQMFAHEDAEEAKLEALWKEKSGHYEGPELVGAVLKSMGIENTIKTPRIAKKRKVDNEKLLEVNEKEYATWRS